MEIQTFTSAAPELGGLPVPALGGLPAPASPELGGLPHPYINKGSPQTWDDLELGEFGEGRKPPMDHLSMLWQMLERHKEQLAEKEVAGANINTTWELVVVQGVLLTLLVVISISWAFCCKRRCFSTSDTVSVSEAFRKLSSSSTKSKDLPPSYSIIDLHSLGITVQDHLNPPPTYLDLFRDTDLQYLDLEAGHSRMARLSFCEPEPGPASNTPRLARVSVASCATCNSEAPVIVPIRSERSSVSSASSSSSASRRSSRNSRVSFSEEVECSNGSIRRLSSATLSRLGSRNNSRKSSSSSEGGSKKSSLVETVQRKMGSSSPSLDAELSSRLARVERGDTRVERGDTRVEREESRGVEEVTAEGQAERAARICDVIVEEK